MVKKPTIYIYELIGKLGRGLLMLVPALLIRARKKKNIPYKITARSSTIWLHI